MRFYEGKTDQIRDLVGCECSRIKTHETAVYLSTIRQLACGSF
jgi:hypothetical protein